MRPAAIHLRRPTCRRGLMLLLLGALVCAPPRALSKLANAQDRPATAARLSDPPTVEQVLAAWETGANRIRSYDAYVTTEHRTLLDGAHKPRAEPVVSVAENRQIYREGLRRVKDLRSVGFGNDANFLRTQIWDGRRALLDDRAFGQGISLAERFEGPQGDLEMHYRDGYANTSFFEIFRDRSGATVERREGAVFVLHTPTTLGKYYNLAPFGYRVWLDSRRNFLPIRIQTLYPPYFEPKSDQEWIYYETEITLDEAAQGVWAPVKGVTRGFPPVLQTAMPPLVSYELTTTVDRAKSRFAVEIPAETFELDPPVDPQLLRAAEANLAERTRNERTNRLGDAVERAKRERRRLLLVLGEHRAGDFKELHRLFSEDEDELRRNLAGFRLVYANPRSAVDVELIRKLLKVDMTGMATPAMVVFSEDGTVLSQRPKLTSGDPPRLNANLVRQFLKSYSAVSRNDDDNPGGATDPTAAGPK